MKTKDLPPYVYQCVNCESGGFEAFCQEIPDLRAYGETPEEAFREIETAVAAWLEVLEEEGLKFPVAMNAFPTDEPEPIEPTHYFPEISVSMTAVDYV